MADERGKERQHRNRVLIEEWSRMRKWDRKVCCVEAAENINRDSKDG